MKTCSQASVPRSSPCRLCLVKGRLDPDRTSDSVLEISLSMSQGGLCGDTGRLGFRGLILFHLRGCRMGKLVKKRCCDKDDELTLN